MRKITKKKLFYLGMSAIAFVGVSSVLTMGIHSHNPKNNVNKKFDTLGERLDGSDSSLKDDVLTSDKNLSNRDNNLPKLEKPGTNNEEHENENNKTIIKFLLNDESKTQIGETIELTEEEFESFNLNLNVPEGYELLNKNIEIEKNSENLIFIKEIVKDLIYKTTLRFIFDEKIISSEVVTTKNDEKIILSRYIPSGYKLENENFEVIINQVNEINLVKIVENQPEKTEEEKPKEIKTILKYFYEVNLIKEIEISSNIDAKINAGQYLPYGYELVESSIDVIIGQTNSIQVQPIPVEPTEPTVPENPESENEIFDDTLIKEEMVTTKLIYKDNQSKEVVLEKTIETKKGELILVNSYLPEGYELVEPNQLAIPGIDNEILVVKIQKETIKALDTIIKFNYNNKTIESKTFKLLENSEHTIKDINYVPLNYHLVDETIKIKVGQENIINVEPDKEEIRLVTTTLIYHDNNIEILKKDIEKPEGETIDYKEHLPEGYEFVNQNYSIIYGKENKIEIQPKKKLVTTTLVFKEGDKVISEKTIKGNDDEVIIASNYLPNNYTLVDSNVSVNTGETNEISIKKVEEIHQTVSTKLIFILDGSEIGYKSISSLDNAVINVNSHVPIGYKAKNTEQVIKVGETNKVEIIQSAIINQNSPMGMIMINWITEDGTILDPFQRFERSGDEIPVIQYIPNGYEAFDSNEARKVVIANTNKNVAFVKIKKKQEVVILPTPEVQPVTPEEPEKTEEVENTPAPTPKPEPTPKPDDSNSNSEKIIKDKTNIAGKPIDPNSVNVPDLENPDWKKYENLDKNKITSETINGTKELVNTLYTAIGKDGLNDEKALRDALSKQGVPSNIIENWVEYTKNYRTKYQEPGRDFLLHLRLWMEKVKKDIDKYAEKGMVPNLDFLNRLYRNESGGKTTWYVEEGGSWTYPNPLDSPVIKKIVDQNSTRRVMNYDTWYSRDPKSIQEGNFPGWSKNDISSSYSSSLSGSSKVYSYTKDGKTLNVLEVDVRNSESYRNFKSDIEKLQGQLSGGINGIVIRNIGGFGAPSDLKDVFRSLPSTIQKLTLFFEGKDTSSLIALKDKHIREIELYTSQNGVLGLDKDWAINPNALKGVDFVPYDYNNDIDPNKVADDALRTTSITFQVLKFDAEDNITTINEGLRIAFQDKYDLRVFQGYWGEGSWITHLDFSNVKEIRSLKDMELYGRVFYDLTLFNPDNKFEIKTSDLARTQFSALIVKHPSDYGKLHFKNENNSTVNVNTLYISGNASNLEEGWGTQLAAVISAGRNIFKEILVDDPNMFRLVSEFNTYNWQIKVK
ncbi:putative immunoglobulin-blocking virulence protein [Mycoplasma anserisalpingitidis]|uniref:putative immunoglobulin-blocking virulence protein n=1 Tax=Mycoplasma anserisalpingitidis TaxID=519450 RepID=UPI001CF64548|nr:putative immunoglobulin-blocking virulence protein [Mycoplasma anserisalpingitidis]UCU26872.1 putative immunoglobulin-blocking virulence protein [Mycoplasma anserisalpingitidis]UCU27711.1 putative immunoglobulin-blocking virulence protein [Mycoplasma anserisalpingitidis]